MKSYAQIIIKTSLKTVAYTISAVVMCLLLIFSFFPTLAVDFYSMIGYKNREYYYQTVLAKKDAIWAYKSAQSAIELDRQDNEKSERISHFLTLSDDNAVQIINNSNLVSSPSKAYDVLLYSVENYMAVEYARIKGEVWTGSKFVSKDEAVVEILLSTTAHDCAMMINEITEIGQVDNLSDILLKSETFSSNGLEELFLLRSIVNFTEKFNVDYEVWGMPVLEYYEERTIAYINSK